MTRLLYEIRAHILICFCLFLISIVYPLCTVALGGGGFTDGQRHDAYTNYKTITVINLFSVVCILLYAGICYELSATIQNFACIIYDASGYTNCMYYGTTGVYYIRK